MKKLTFIVALIATTFSFAQQGSFSFALAEFDITAPLESEANLGYFMSDDIMVSFGMSNWDNFTVGARYYGICENMFIQATTTSEGGDDPATEAVEDAERTYAIGAAIGWSLDLGIWKLQFEPMIMLDDIQNFDPKLGWALRFNL